MGCFSLMWLVYPRKLWHYYILTVLQLLDLATLPLLAMILLTQNHKPQAYTGFALFGMYGVMSLRGARSMLCNNPVEQGEYLFRVYASDVVYGPLGVLVLAVPLWWRSVLNRALQHRMRDGGVFESKELTMTFFIGLPKLAGVAWLYLWFKQSSSTFLLLAACAGTTLLALLPRCVRWAFGGVYCCARCRPCCIRCCCNTESLAPPYMNEMWGNMASELTKDPGTQVSSPTKVYPLSDVVRTELEGDADRVKQKRLMATLNKPNTEFKFPELQSYRVMEALEMGQDPVLALAAAAAATAEAAGAEALPVDPAPAPAAARATGWRRWFTRGQPKQPPGGEAAAMLTAAGEPTPGAGSPYPLAGDRARTMLQRGSTVTTAGSGPGRPTALDRGSTRGSAAVPPAPSVPTSVRPSVRASARASALPRPGGEDQRSLPGSVAGRPSGVSGVGVAAGPASRTASPVAWGRGSMASGTVGHSSMVLDEEPAVVHLDVTSP